MRVLLWHVNAFRAEVTERGRSTVVEPADPAALECGEGLLVLVAAERGDERDIAAVVRLAAEGIAEHARRLRVSEAVILPFAHLFAELAAPETAVMALDALVTGLGSRGLRARRAPFGWFHRLVIDAKGHPLSRVARRYEVPLSAS